MKMHELEKEKKNSRILQQVCGNFLQKQAIIGEKN